MKTSKSWSTLAALAAAICSTTAAWAASPVDVDGLALWLDAADFADSANGAKVSSWIDKASGLNLAQGTDARRPWVNTAGPKGLPVVHFERSGVRTPRYLEINSTAIPALFNVTNTSFAVAMSTTSGGNGGKENISFVFSRPGYHSGMFFQADGGDSMTPTTQYGYIRWNSDTANGNQKQSISVQDGGYNAGDFLVLSAINRGGTTIKGMELEFFANNLSLGTASDTNRYFYKQSSNYLRIGASNYNTDNSCGLNGEIAEIMVFNRELDAAERRTVWYYLAGKWGIIPFTLAYPVNGNTHYTASSTVSILETPELEDGMEYQISLATDPADLAESDWVPASTPVPATFTFPQGTQPGVLDVRFWIRVAGGDDPWTNSVHHTIEFTPLASKLDTYVASDGNDATGDGSAEYPYATITHALSVANEAATHLRDICTVHVGPGTFSAESGETFPFVVSNNVAVVGAGIGRTIVDGNREGNFFDLQPSTVSSRISGFSLRRAQRFAFNVNTWGGIVEDCEISDIVNTYKFIYVNEASARDFTLSGLVVTNITGTTNNQNTRQLVDLCGATKGLLTITNCVFDSISTQNAAGQHSGNFRILSSSTVQTAGWNSKIVDTTFSNITAPGGNNGEGCCIMFGKTADNGSHLIDRCVFHDINFTNNGEVLIGGDNANATGQTVKIADSLFYNIHFKNNGSSYTSSAVGGFRVAPLIYNCTFHNVDTVVRPSASTTIQLFNSVISDCGHLAMANSPATYVYLNNVNIYNTGDSSNYSAANSKNVTSFDPYYKNADSANFMLKPLSQLVDAGDNSYVQGDNDLALGRRIVDGNGDETPVVDLGAYEYDPSAAGARFVAGAATYGLFEGKSVAIPVWIEPVMERESIAATVVYPDGVTGVTNLTFATGLETNLLVVTASDPLIVPNGTLLELEIADDGGELDSASVGIQVNSREVSLPGFEPRIFLRVGESASFLPQLPNEFFAAPETIAINAGSQTGDFGNTIDWNGTGIPLGASVADGTLSLACANAGSSKLTLNLPDGWVFAESGETTLTVEVVGFESPLYLSPDGSDTAGIGTEDSPLRTMTYAIPKLVAGETLRLLPGIYCPTNGEVFPVTVPPGIAIVGQRGEGDAPESTSIVDPDGTERAFILGTLGADPGTIPGGALRSLVIRNAAGTGIYARYWGGDITDCAIREFVSGTYLGACSALYISPSRGDVVLSGTEIGCITSDTPVVAYLDSGNGSLTVTNCWLHDLCGNGKIAWEFTGGMFNTRVPVTVSDTLVENIVMPGNGGSESMGVLHSYNVQATYLRNVFRNIVIASGHERYSLLSVNRCSNAIVANCLFYGISSASTTSPLLSGYDVEYNVINCTFDDITALFGDYDTYRNRTLKNSTVTSCEGISVGSMGPQHILVRNSNLYGVGEGAGYATNESVNVFSFDPLFKDPANGDYHFRSNSPLIDKGDNALLVAAMGGIDLDHAARILDGDWDKEAVVDLGCYELDPPSFGTLIMLK